MNKNNERVIFHVDVNSAFLSWTAVDRMKNGHKVDLRKIPSVIGGDEKNRRGVVLAKSVPAKKYGIITGESLFTARRKCPNLTVVSPSFSLYEQCSRAMMEILMSYTTRMQKFSIDECFLDLTNVKRNYKNPVKLAEEIKERVKKELGFTVNIGISSNKLLAKMASDFQKPDKVHTLFKSEIKSKMWTLPVGDLFMVGQKSVPKLNNLNIFTIGDLAQYDLNILKDIFKSKGILMWEYANGVDNSEVEQHKVKMKAISNSTTLAYDITKRSDAHKVLLALVEKTSTRLRNSKRCCFSIAVNIRNSEFVDYSHQKKLYVPTNSTDIILSTAKELFDSLWKGEAIRLLGVTLSNLSDEEIRQISIFDDDINKTNKEKTIDKTIDELRNKYGSKAVFRLVNIKE